MEFPTAKMGRPFLEFGRFIKRRSIFYSEVILAYGAWYPGGHGNATRKAIRFWQYEYEYGYLL